MYVKIVKPLVKMGYIRNSALVPMVKNPPTNVDSFESYAYDFYESNSFYASSISSSAVFSGGIYSISPQTGEKYRNIDGSTTFSSYNILTPVMEVSDSASISAVLYNAHSEYNRAKAIDKIIDAWNNNKQTISAATSMIQLIQDVSPRPASIMFYPIAPALNASELVGFISAVQNWDTVLFQAVPTNSKSIQIVVSDGVRLATFVVSSDSAKFIGWGDMHDRTYDHYRRSYTPPEVSSGYSAFSFAIYPTAEFFSPNDMVASIVGCGVTVAFILIVAVALLVHLAHLQGKLWQQGLMLSLKQRFVRFISHEIRTPLNTVCIGLKLLLGEVDQSLKALQKEIGQQPTRDASIEVAE